MAALCTHTLQLGLDSGDQINVFVNSTHLVPMNHEPQKECLSYLNLQMICNV